MTDIKKIIEDYSKLLTISKAVSYTESERRSGEFLYAMAQITNYRHLLAQEKIRLVSVQTAVYAQEMSKGTAKTMTENKLVAESSAEYTKAREELEGIDNDISYLKAYYEIFSNAHVFYRQLAKGESGL